MAAGPVEAALVMILCRDRSSWRACEQDKLASDAQQLGHVPTLVGLLALRERVVDRQKALRNLPDPSQALRQHAEKSRAVANERDLRESVESGAKTSHPGDEIAALRRTEEFKNHVQIGLRNGLTVGEIEEALIQATAYAGFPARTPQATRPLRCCAILEPLRTTTRAATDPTACRSDQHR